MIKKIYWYLMFLGALVACSKNNDVGIQNYTRQIDLSGSDISSYQAQAALLYSTDGGNTFVGFPVLKAGKSYKVKLIYNPDPDTNTFPDKGSVVQVMPSDCFTIDWSSSSPQPINVDANGVAEFAAGANKISVTVRNTYTPFSLSSWLGGWYVDEGESIEKDSASVSIDGAPDAGSYLTALQQDTGDPSKIWLRNVRGVGLSAYMNINASTSNSDQTVNIPSQTIAPHVTFSGNGKYDQCRKTLQLNVVYSYVDTTRIPADTTITVKDKTTVGPNGETIHVYQNDTTIVSAHNIPYPAQYKWTYTFDSTGVVPQYCAYNAVSWVGAWKGDETETTCCGGSDPNNFTQDPGNPNKFVMDNWWGDHVNAYLILEPSTNYFDQLVQLPAQNTSEGGFIHAAIGTYNQCTGKISVRCVYDIGGSSYEWTYVFHK